MKADTCRKMFVKKFPLPIPLRTIQDLIPVIPIKHVVIPLKETAAYQRKHTMERNLQQFAMDFKYVLP